MKWLELKNVLKSSYCYTFLMILLFFGANIYFSFATDTYRTFDWGFEKSANDMLFRNGRPIIAFSYYCHHLLNLSNESFYYISSILALIFLFLALIIVQKILELYIHNGMIIVLLSFISIANIFIIEYFMFIEKSSFMLATLFSVIGWGFFVLYLRKMKIKLLCLALMMEILAAFTYQGIVTLFVIFCLPFIYKHAKDLKFYFIYLIYAVAIYGFAIMANMLAFKYIFKSTRVIENQNYISNVKVAIEGLVYYIVENTFSIFPRYLFGIIILVALITDVFAVVYNTHRGVRRILHIMIIVLVSCVFPIAPIIQGSGWIAMRIVYPVASIFGIIIIDYYINGQDLLNIKNKICIKKISNVIMIFLIFLVIVIQYISFNKIYIDKYKLNISDENRAQYIGQAITEYQNETKNEIKKIAFYRDASTKHPYYPNLYCDGALVVSSFYADWSDIASLNYYLNTDYEKIEKEQKYIDYFQGRDWNELSKGQLLFEGDTLHLCMY